jgi:serine/threonine protein kinase
MQNNGNFREISRFSIFQDFGISRTKPSASAPITMNVGTLTFTAPEVLVDGRYNEKCDVYSMGVTRYL